MLLNYLLECHISMTFQKIQKNFRSLCTLVIKIHESCCSIFNELCFSLHRLAARSLFIIPLCRSFVKRFFKLFSSFFVLSAFADFAVPLSCSSDSIPHSSPLVNPFLQVFSGFFDFSCQWRGKGRLRWAYGFCIGFTNGEYHVIRVDFIGSSRGRLERDRGLRSPIPLQHLS